MRTLNSILFLVAFQQIFALPTTLIPETDAPPDSRISAASTYDYIENRIIIFGGSTDKRLYKNDLWSFNLSSHIWRQLNPVSSILPDPRVGSILLFNKQRNSLILIAGKTTGGSIADVWSFNLEYFEWEKISLNGTKLNPLFDAASDIFEWNGNIYYGIFGGVSEKNSQNSLYLIDANSLNCTIMPNNGDIPVSTAGSRMSFYDNSLYVWGGYAFGVGYDPNLYRYNLDSQKWIKYNFSSSPTGRSWHHTAVISGYFYITPGFNYIKAANLQDIWKINLSTLSEWQQVEFSKGTKKEISCESANILINSTIYQFSGSSFQNDLLYIDLSVNHPKYKTLSPIWNSPAARIRFSMHVVNNYLAVWGGIGVNDELYNDLWLFDIENEKWELQRIDNSPSARSGHASVGIGYGMIIFGGESITGLLNDFYIYSIASGTWEEAVKNSDTVPSPTKGACMAFTPPYIFLFGGLTDSGITNDFWIYDTTVLLWTSISSTGIEVPPLVWHKCYTMVKNNDIEFYAIMGETDEYQLNQNAYKYSLRTNQWELVKNLNFISGSVSESSIVLFSKHLIILGGELQGTYSTGSVIFLNLETYTIDSYYILDFNIFGHQTVYVKNDLYIFGGGVSKTNIINLLPSASLYKVGINSTIDSPCSKGTYFFESECIWCSPGTYNENINSTECLECPFGTQNSYTGSASSIFCLPCPYGTYSNTNGTGMCKKCPGDKTCNVGSTEPTDAVFYSSKSSSQPDDFDPKYDLIQEYTTYSGIFFAIILSTFLLAIALKKQFRQSIIRWDLYDDKHNEDDQPMWSRKTSIGGVFSIISLIIAAYLVSISFVQYRWNNIAESKSLIPIENLIKQAGRIKGDLFIVIGIYNYGGTCVENDSCNENIILSFENIQGDFSKINCIKQNKNCFVEITCKSCSLDTGAYLYLLLSETTSYCSYFSANVSADSSIPGEKSSLNLYVSPPKDEVFIGNNPSYVHFDMTPSLFISQSSSWPTNQTGFMVSVSENYTPGDSSTVYKMILTRSLKIVINLDVNTIGFLTVRSINTTFLLFISALIGSVSGIIDMGGFFMQKIEKGTKAAVERSKNQQKTKKLIDAVKKMELNFKTNYTLSDSEISSQAYSKDGKTIIPYELQYLNVNKLPAASPTNNSNQNRWSMSSISDRSKI
ncbi:unnamed protein product [Blepharisma stoltei]|uniref:Tyrosine-protein kinase ephrin type A/B receptor-like domain-containing protein n=1 Tax=Blepharisma stoltei TaxID=1481888 RepID=A0AAU9IUE0_9CILI|nr:unnamed protein product [Blepharisma stoltei]